MIDKNKKVYVCKCGHIQSRDNKCFKCGSLELKPRPKTLYKEK